MWRNNKGRAARDKEALMHDKQWDHLYHVILKMGIPPPDILLPINNESLLKILSIHQSIRTALEQTVLPQIHPSLVLTNDFGKTVVEKVITEADVQLKDIHPHLSATVEFMELKASKEGRTKSMYMRLHEGR